MREIDKARNAGGRKNSDATVFIKKRCNKANRKAIKNALLNNEECAKNAPKASVWSLS